MKANIFIKTTHSIFKIDNSEHLEIFNVDSRRNKTKIIVNEKMNAIELDNIDEIDFKLLPISDSDEQPINSDKLILDLSDVCIFNTILNKSSRSNSSSSCSSKSSNTSDGDSDGDDGNDDDGDDDDDNDHGIDDDEDIGDGEDIDDDEEEDILCSIYNFPVEMICLEKCDNTLDYLMEEDLLNNDEWTSCLFQIIMILTLYQKTFSLTHNDLHTNNIMYSSTEKQYIHYCHNSVYYKVPTYGKIYKIIDFGRSIYKFNGKIMCSDSFHPKGDAASQYNCEPYFDDKKPRLEPNLSFDLCRLSCCLFDNFVEDLEDISTLIKKNKIVELIHQWLLDDKERNILYKTNGDERYPEFKLYKMIARTAHNAIPCEQIEKDIFKKYVTSKKKINKNHKIMNFDKIPNLQ